MSFDKQSSFDDLTQRAEYAFKFGPRAGSRSLRLQDPIFGSQVLVAQKQFLVCRATVKVRTGRQ